LSEKENKEGGGGEHAFNSQHGQIKKNQQANEL
jgi:hypothetical protein